MACRPTRPLSASILAVLVMAGGFPSAWAQDTGTRSGDRIVRRHQAAMTARGAPAPYRGLTISRPPEAAPDEDSIYQDGPVRYNDIRDFSPSPYVTSGVQYPYGLDGIGGYGSGLDFGAGQDSALYDRGAGSRP